MYRIENIPPGTYTLVGWHERSERTEKVLRRLFDRIRNLGTHRLRPESEHTPIFRSIDGHVALDPASAPSAALDSALEAAGIAVPEAPEGTARVLLLAGDDGDPLAGIFAFLDQDGNTASSEPLGHHENISVGAFLEILADRVSLLGATTGTPWSSRAVSPAPSGYAPRQLSELFGLA